LNADSRLEEKLFSQIPCVCLICILHLTDCSKQRDTGTARD
jgi:hypothetical protein